MPAHLPEKHDEALIEFAYGTAHDVSNFLQIIMGFAEFLKSQQKENADVIECVQEILTASNRAKAFMADLLIVGRRNPPPTQQVEIRPLLEQIVERLRAGLDPKVSLELAVDSAPQSAILDPSSLERILGLLCGFACTGMPAGGVIGIRLSGEASQARISVHQPGDGLDPEGARRVCEPFYMKRVHRRGMGLELAVVAGLMDQMHGDLAVDTSPGKGLTIHLSFPNA